MTNESSGAFEDFLTSFKSTASAETSAVNALSELQIDGDDFDSEGGSMDEAQDKEAGPRRRKDAEVRKKYMEILQRVADREQAEICIELDDLDIVSISIAQHAARLRKYSMKKL